MTEDPYRKAIDEMIGGLAQLSNSLTLADPHRVRCLQVAYGWCAEAHRLGKAVLVLFDQDLGHEARPLVRVLLEHTVTLHWLVETGDGAVAAILAEHERNMHKLRKDAEGGPLMPPPSLLAFADSIEVPIVSEVRALRNFRSICDQFSLLNTLYAAFRLESAYIHPSWAGAAAFMAGNSNHPALRPKPSIPTDGLVQLVAACLVWASRDLDDLLANHPWRQRLERIAAELGVPPHLPALPHSTP